MDKMLTIAKRELTSYFYSPIAYVVLGLFVFLSGLFFILTTFAPNQPAEMRQIFFWMVWILIAIVPAISMRLVSEEFNSNTIETLMTTPVSDADVIIGKWVGATVFFAVTLIPTLIIPTILEAFGAPDYGPIFTGYLGLLFVGGLYMAIGAFASVMTKNQIIAFLISVFVILMFTVVTYFVPRFLPANIAQIVMYLNINEQYDDFAKGLIDTSNIVFFLSGIALFLVLAIKVLESRKWR